MADKHVNKVFSALPLELRATMFAQLAALEQAGMPVDRAYASLRLGGTAQHRLAAMRKLLARGSDIAGAGGQTGVFTALETHLLRAAQNAGSPVRTYKRLSEVYTHKAKLAKAVKSRLALPGLTLLLAFFIHPLPALITGTLTMAGYLRACMLPLLGIAGIYALYRNLPQWAESGRINSLRGGFEKLIVHIPVFGPMHVRRQALQFFESLGLLLDAGLSMFEALPLATAAIGNHDIRKDFDKLLPRMEKGATLAQAAAKLQHTGNSDVLALIHTGEESGTLAELLLRHADHEADADAHARQQVADWTPRLVYAAIAAWIAYGLLHSQAFQPPPL